MNCNQCAHYVPVTQDPKMKSNHGSCAKRSVYPANKAGLPAYAATVAPGGKPKLFMLDGRNTYPGCVYAEKMT